MKMFLLTAVASALALSTAASGQVLYSQVVHTAGATGGNGISTFKNLPSSDREIADDFTVPSPGWLVDGASINGVYNAATTTITPNLIVRFYNDVGGAPGTQVGGDIVATNTTNTVTGATYFSRPERKFEVSFPAVTLLPGAYFVSIQPDVNENWFTLTSTPTTPIQGSPLWGRSRTGAPDGAYGVDWTSSQTIFAAEHDLAFTLSGTVIPAPGAFSLLALGGLVAARRRRA